MTWGLMHTMTTEPQVTICPPFKKSADLKLRVAADSSIRLTTQTALEAPVKPSLVPPARNDRRTANERVEAALRAEAVSVALAQPHRGGSDDPRLAFALGRFCDRVWPNDSQFADAMHRAGASYAAEVRAVLVAKGFHVVGCGSENPPPPPPKDNPTRKEIEAMRAVIYGLERTLERADELLRGVMDLCPRAMVRLCFDHEDPSIYDRDVLKRGLYRLALHYGHRKIGVNRP